MQDVELLAGACPVCGCCDWVSYGLLLESDAPDAALSSFSVYGPSRPLVALSAEEYAAVLGEGTLGGALIFLDECRGCGVLVF